MRECLSNVIDVQIPNLHLLTFMGQYACFRVSRYAAVYTLTFKK